MQLSNQALGAVMLALQKSLLEQSDIVPLLQGFVLTDTDEGLIVENPPIVEFDAEEPADGYEDEDTEEIA